eukprot:scaffold6871_cov75-Phaeocystis_antarctica.AAC.1
MSNRQQVNFQPVPPRARTSAERLTPRTPRWTSSLRQRQAKRPAHRPLVLRFVVAEECDRVVWARFERRLCAPAGTARAPGGQSRASCGSARGGASRASRHSPSRARCASAPTAPTNHPR